MLVTWLFLLGAPTLQPVDDDPRLRLLTLQADGVKPELAETASGLLAREHNRPGGDCAIALTGTAMTGAE